MVQTQNKKRSLTPREFTAENVAMILSIVYSFPYEAQQVTIHMPCQVLILDKRKLNNTDQWSWASTDTSLKSLQKYFVHFFDLAEWRQEKRQVLYFFMDNSVFLQVFSGLGKTFRFSLSDDRVWKPWRLKTHDSFNDDAVVPDLIYYFYTVEIAVYKNS